MKSTFIYALCCPFTQEMRYIGKANNPKIRFSKHKSLAGNNYDKNEWIQSLIILKTLPIIKILEEVTFDTWKEKEKSYIKKYRELGYKLLNISGGANGSEFGNITSFNGRNAVKVVCLTKEGLYLDTFKSVKEGSEFCGKDIYNALKGNTKTTGGYLWLYENKYKDMTEENLDIFIKNSNINNSSKNGEKTRFGKIPAWNKGIKGIKLKPNKSVYQYTKKGEFLKKWNTAKDASIELTGFAKSEEAIARCARGKSFTSNGYKWYYNLLIN